MLDNAPLGEAPGRRVRLRGVDAHIERGDLRALAINATSYTTGHAVSFFAARPPSPRWQRMRRRGEPRDALAARTCSRRPRSRSCFPPARIGDDYYMDGSVRQLTPLSAPLNLGARRVLVIAVGQFGGQRAPPGVGAGAIRRSRRRRAMRCRRSFSTTSRADVERMMHVNRLVGLMPPERDGASGMAVGHVDALVLAPSRDLGALALELRRSASRRGRHPAARPRQHAGTGANLTSYLLFDRGFCRALLELGYADTMARREELEAFLAGTGAAYVPVLPPDLA